MNTPGEALRFLWLSTLLLLLAGCSTLLSGRDLADSDAGAEKPASLTGSQIATRGNQPFEPEAVPDLPYPKPKWRPATVPALPPQIANADLDTESVNFSGEANADVQLLLGKTFLEVKQELGQPAWIRDVYPARVWGYDTESCSLQVFFYPKLDQAGDYRVLTYEGAELDQKIKSPEVPASPKVPAISGSGETNKPSALGPEEIQACFLQLVNKTSLLPGLPARNGEQVRQPLLNDNGRFLVTPGQR
ncbi:hypothetical protein [Kiloniella laminariae]|uniref:hypothetical protein n=1 Tax=Kiloniella laminariae TaxID=454162 RepID=UPI00036B7BFC|nr:hypothetical protein [Kiloniella laminariae]